MKKLVKENLNEGFASADSEKLEKIFSMIGYDDFYDFIGDNPGCYSAIVEWIDEYFSEKISDEMLDEPERLEELGLYTAAEKIREKEEE